MTWNDWHMQEYNNVASTPYQRNQIVQEYIKDFISDKEELVIVSMGAGQGRDILPLLHNNITHTVYLIDTEQKCLNYAEEYSLFNKIDNVHLINEDAFVLKTYNDIPKADLIIFCGMLNNVNEDDVNKFAKYTTLLLKDGGEIIWSRRTYDNDYNKELRAIFTNNGYVELNYTKNDTSFVCKSKMVSRPEILNNWCPNPLKNPPDYDLDFDENTQFYTFTFTEDE